MAAVADQNRAQNRLADQNRAQNRNQQLDGKMKVYFIKDIISDIVGGSGYTLISVSPYLDYTAETVKLLASIGGLMLVYLSIKLKVELLKEKKIENDERRKQRAKEIESDSESDRQF